MRICDYIEQSFSNLGRKKLRTSLTTFGVVIGIGALVSMFAFGQGVQKNVTEKFKELELFNYVNVLPGAGTSVPGPPFAPEDPDDADHRNGAQAAQVPQRAGTEQSCVLDDEFIDRVSKIEGVESAFPEIRFPAVVRFREKDNFSLVQVLPAKICQVSLKRLPAGQPYASDDVNSLIISDSLLHTMGIKDAKTVIGEQIEVSTLTFDVSLFNPAIIASVMGGDEIPFRKESYTFTIVGVFERMGFGGFLPLRSDVFIPPGPAEKMKKLSVTNIWDFFSAAGGPGQADPAPVEAGASLSPRTRGRERKGYSLVSIRLSSRKYIAPVKRQVEDWGFRTFALIDELKDMNRAFIFMDMFLLAVAMIGVTVASLGIVNTMVMSILERYKEIAICKAVGASDRDVKKIFFFESGAIGFLGGVFGLALGWAVSMVINQVVNYFLARQGSPYVDYFSFPWWLCLGAVAFSVVVSLAAGVYPTLRAARVDPVVALRHD